LQQQRKLDDAIAAFRKAVELDPKNARAHNNLGGSLLNRGRLDEAFACCKKAIELDPKYRQAHQNLGAIHFKQRRLDEAIACFKNAIELDPQIASAHTYLGVALREKGRLNEAIAAYREAVRVQPNSALAHNNLAWILATSADVKLRDPDGAVKSAKRAVELAPKDSTYPSTLGVAYYRAGEFKQAITAMEKSMALRKGGDSNEWFFLAMVHWQLGNKDDARKWFDRAAEWMDRNAKDNEELRRFRTEAAELLEIKKK
jgi:superkiller protein 3